MTQVNLVNKRLILSFLGSAFSAGFLYWFFESFSTLLSSITAGNIPYDMLFLLMLCVGFSLAFSITLGLPIVLILKKNNFLNLFTVLLSAVALSVIIIGAFHSAYPWEKPLSIFVGLLSGLLFYFLLKLKGISEKK